MNMPGFTAEQGLRQHQHGGNYLLHSTDWPVGGVGDVRPQLSSDGSLWLGAIRGLCRVMLEDCKKGDCVSYNRLQCTRWGVL